MCDHLADGPITYSGLRALLRKHKPDIFVIDAFHLVKNDNIKGQAAQWQTISDLIYGLKTLSVSMKLSTVVTVQANRGAADVNKPTTIGRCSV